jgi:SAM-dependent methyltransferase
LIRKYRETGGSGIGVDVFQWENMDLVVENSADLPFEDESFDTISFVACLNHIPNRQEVLREGCRLLKRDGQMVITNLNPACSRIWHKVAYWDPDLAHRGMHKGEVFGFSDQEFRILMRKVGLKIIKKRYFNWGTNALYICRK